MYEGRIMKVLAPVNINATHKVCDWNCPHIRSVVKKDSSAYESACSLFTKANRNYQRLDGVIFEGVHRAARCSACVDAEVFFKISQLPIN